MDQIRGKFIEIGLTENNNMKRGYIFYADLEKESTILLEQIRTLDKRKIEERIASLDINTLKKLNIALGTSI